MLWYIIMFYVSMKKPEQYKICTFLFIYHLKIWLYFYLTFQIFLPHQNLGSYILKVGIEKSNLKLTNLKILTRSNQPVIIILDQGFKISTSSSSSRMMIRHGEECKATSAGTPKGFTTEAPFVKDRQVPRANSIPLQIATMMRMIENV